jgi:2OG-Fe(II) oxygenase superfamily
MPRPRGASDLRKPPARLPVAVWGGPSRLCYHGVPELKDGRHETVGRMRINLTFRGAL